MPRVRDNAIQSAQPRPVARITKKAQILSLFREAGVRGIEELVLLTNSRPSYVAKVLRQVRVLTGYFDLYTSSERPMNVYSRFFAKKLGFKDRDTAEQSVQYLNALYIQFERIGDRAGQHHALLMGLTMRNRALWSGKLNEATVFAQWLTEKLNAPSAPALSSGIAKLERELRTHERALLPARRKR